MSHFQADVLVATSSLTPFAFAMVIGGILVTA